MPNSAEYMREYRKRNKAGAEANKAANRAYYKALSRLADEFPERFAELVNDERALRELPPVGAHRGKLTEAHQKAKGKEPKPVVDVMAALEASLKKSMCISQPGIVETGEES